MARESTQHKLDRVRSPRVHITYDVEIGDAIEMKELPFVIGVLADLSGKPEEPLPRLKDRKFVEIDRDNFNEVLKGMKPRLAFQVDNSLADDDTKLGVELRFQNMDDFSPSGGATGRAAAKARSRSASSSNGSAGQDRRQRQAWRALAGDHQQHGRAAAAQRQERAWSPGDYR